MAKVIKMPGLEMFHIKVLIPYWEEMSDIPMETSPYRIIAVLPETTLSEMGRLIIDAFEFDHDHLFGFYDNFKGLNRSKIGYEFIESDEEELDDGIVFFQNRVSDKNRFNIEKFTVGDIFLRKGNKWLMLYDYGDEWNFWVSLIDKSKIDPSKKYDRIVESKFDAPPQYPNFDEDDF